jgi:hypothetical protein
MPKSVYPGQGRLMCDGSWGRCEADAKWISAWSCALCSDCSQKMNYLPSGQVRRVPLAGGFVRKRFCTWNPAHAIKNKAEKDALIAGGAPMPELSNLIGNYAYVRFIELCKSPGQYLTADELAPILNLDADQLRSLHDLALLGPDEVRELVDDGAVERGFIETYAKNRAPMNELMPMFKEIASHYQKGIRLDGRAE